VCEYVRVCVCVCVCVCVSACVYLGGHLAVQPGEPDLCVYVRM
jgi:hypothetical protein